MGRAAAIGGRFDEAARRYELAASAFATRDPVRCEVLGEWQSALAHSGRADAAERVAQERLACENARPVPRDSTRK